MSSPRIFGKAVVYGIGGTIAMYGEVINGTRVQQSQQASKTFDSQFLMGQTNEVESIQATKHRKEISIQFVPAGISGSVSNTVAEAKNVLSSSLPDSVTRVTVSGCNDSDFNGTYAYLGGASVSQTFDNYAVVTINLVAWDDVDMTFITTQVS